MQGHVAANANPSGSFYDSKEWKVLRYKALKLHGGRCQCCGRGAKDGSVLHVDHIRPRKRYPELALRLDNLQVLCASCNTGKGAWDQTDWRDPLSDEYRSIMHDRAPIPARATHPDSAPAREEV